MVLRMDAKRKELIKKSSNEREVRYEDIRRGARAPLGHRSTVKNAFRREDIPVAARRPREKPQRSQDHAIERFQFAKAWYSSFFASSGLWLPRCRSEPHGVQVIRVFFLWALL